MATAEEVGPILAIDTSSAQAGIALDVDGRVASLAWHADRSHTVSMLPQVHRLLELADLAPADLGGIAVAVGPGAFTGLRVGLAVAKGLSFALDLPLVGLSTLEATALPWLASGCMVVATVAAGRGRVVWAAFERGEDGLPLAIVAPRNATVGEMAEALPGFGRPVLVVGEAPEGASAVLSEQPGVSVVPPPLALRRPEALLALARPRFLAGAADDPVTLEPLYLGRDA